jgi:hypothetical protein
MVALTPAFAHNAPSSPSAGPRVGHPALSRPPSSAASPAAGARVARQRHGGSTENTATAPGEEARPRKSEASLSTQRVS